MSQNDSLLDHFKSGKSITRLEALFSFGIQNITARICDLRDEGWDVHTKIKTDPKGRKYAEYFIPHYRNRAKAA